MQLLPFFLAFGLLVATLAVEATNCTVQEIRDALQPLTSDSNFATCQSDSNYTLLSLQYLSGNQSAAFCASAACQTLLHKTLTSGLLPDCWYMTLAIGCTEDSTLEERAVDDEGDEGTLGLRVDNAATVVGHSVPMDAELGAGMSLISLIA
jgi:hypothetical protein